MVKTHPHPDPLPEGEGKTVGAHGMRPGHTKVRRHSKVETDLPQEVRGEVDRLLLEPGITYADIKVFLVSKGYDLSRSSIGRYGKDYLATYQRLRISIDQAKAMKGEVGEGLALEEAVSNLALQLALDGLMSGKINLESMPKILSEIGKIQSSSVQREKLKADLHKRVQQVAEEVKTEVKKAGLSDEAANDIRKRILGIGE